MEKKVVSTLSGDNHSLVICQNNQGSEIRATIIRLTRYQVMFEVCAPTVILRTSEVLSDFKIVIQDSPVYSGRAVVSNLMNTGAVLVCEATLDDSWLDLAFQRLTNTENTLRSGFDNFLLQWQKVYKVLPEFKVVIADLQSLLIDIKLWLEQVELKIRSSPSGDRLEMEREAAQELAKPVLTAIDSLGDRFEEIASRLEQDLRPVHIYYTKRFLHALLLCSPFAYRTYQKPLGYAGDYEMVNMIMRDPYEGSSLFAKMLNAWFLNQLPAQAHRNRIKILKDKLIEASARAARSSRPARIFNLGCGPAGEIQEFLREHVLCENTIFTLLDFNEETVQHTSKVLEEVKNRFARRTPIQIQKKSVQHLLRDAAKPGVVSGQAKYDFIYCAGLFDYLSDRVCRQLMLVLYQWLAPGGTLLATNVDETRPFRNKLEFILDWNLIYRHGKVMTALIPGEVPPEDSSITSDATGVNAFIEITKPENA